MTAVSTAPELRDYQVLAVKHAERAIVDGDRHLYLSMPTGTGKTRVMGELTRRARRGGRVLGVVHTRELVAQLAAGLSAGADEAAGIVMAGADDPGAGIVVGSVQTLRGARLDAALAAGPVKLLLIDECHHVTPRNGYATLIDRVKAACPGVVVIGVTATPYRADRARMTDVLPRCAFERSIVEMAAAGWLAPLAWSSVQLDGLDLSSVRTGQVDGDADYQVDELAAAVRQPGIVEATAALTTPLLGDRLTVVFAADVAHALALADAYRTAGLTAGAIFGAMPADERARLLADWRTGRVQVVTSVATLLEGFDLPALGAAVIARPTMSPGRYVQQVGRVSRTAPGKTDALVIDVTGAPFGPDSFDARQLTLPVIFGFRPEPGGLDDGERSRKPGRTLRLVDPLGQSQMAWGCDSGVFYAGAGVDTAAVLIPDRNGSGLYRPVLVFTRGRNPVQPLTHVDAPGGGWVPLRDAVGATALTLARNGRLPSLTDKKARWREGEASVAQLKFLAVFDAPAAERGRTEGMSAGDAALTITGQLALRKLRMLNWHGS